MKPAFLIYIFYVYRGFINKIQHMVSLFVGLYIQCFAHFAIIVCMPEEIGVCHICIGLRKGLCAASGVYSLVAHRWMYPGEA